MATAESKIIGSVVMLGFVLGLVYALEFIFVTEEERHGRLTGANLRDLGRAATFLTPGASVLPPRYYIRVLTLRCLRPILTARAVLLLGAFLMARVPPEGMNPTYSRGYSWYVYFSLPMLSFAAMACVAVVLYMAYECAVDAYAGKAVAAMDHFKALVCAVAYSWAAVQTVSGFETRAARARKASKEEAKSRRAGHVEKMKREFASMGATILEGDDDDFSAFRETDKDL